MAKQGEVWLGVPRQARHGESWLVVLGCGMAGVVLRGAVRIGWARHGMARQACHGKASLGKAR